MAFRFQPSVVTDGLILHLDAANSKSYPTTGTITSDLSRTAITGSLINGPTFSTDGGGSFLLDGTNDYIDISQNTAYQFTNTQPFSINSWVKCTNTTGYPSIVAFALGESRGYYLSVDINLLRSSSFFFDYYDGSSGPSSYRGIQGITGSITTGSWVNITATSVDNTVGNMKVYQNGVLTSFTNRGSGTPTSINYSGVPMRIGARETGSAQFFKGNIAQVQIYNRALSATEVLQNYNALCGRFGKTPTITDNDALNFVNSANISSETQQSAINTLVTDLKGAGLWGKMKAIYPFIGGTATTHKWNLKDPRDADAAFRLVFYGGWTHSSNGADPNGTTGYADTLLVPTTSLTENSTHMMYYSRENVADSGVEIGAYPSDTNFMFLVVRFSGDLASSRMYSTNNILVTNTNGSGMILGTRTSATSHKLFRNTTQLGSDTVTSSGFSSNTLRLYLGARNQYNGTFQYTTKQCAFATIGDGLTDGDAANLYTIVQKYQTTLGRQV